MLLGCVLRLRSRARPPQAPAAQALPPWRPRLKQPLAEGAARRERRSDPQAAAGARLLSGGMSAGAGPSPGAAVVHRLSEYRPPVFRATDVELDVALDDVTKVVSRVKYVRAEGSEGADLELHCERKPANMTLQRVALDGRELAQGSYSVGPSSVRIPAQLLSASFTLECSVTVEPAVNTSLSGLYKSGAMMTTQMEAEGFRNFCPFVDRPDHLATYTTRLEADKERFPVLLSNGEDIERGDLAGGKKHYVVWRDLHPKPSYLFAIVAGDLAVRRDSFVTRPSGKVVQLAIWVDKEDAGKTEWAMRCIKSAMAWDEMRFGREYDVRQFTIVGTRDFNMGAMEVSDVALLGAALLGHADRPD